MAAPAYEQLLVVQELDTTMDQRRHRIAHHPLKAEIEAVDAQVVDVAATVAEVEARQHDLQRDLKRLADEVAMIDEKRSQVDGRLYDGSVTATKDLLALQDEAKMLLDRKSGIEDDELELMESLEQVDTELQPSVARREQLAAERQQLDESLTVDTAELEVDLVSIAEQRSDAESEVPAELLAHYERLRVDFGGVAVAKLVGSTCDGCHMTLSAVAIDQIKKQPDDAVVTCDDCGRLLIR
jgi:predicted  nucleic acid-binding Zn-ribbon protein